MVLGNMDVGLNTQNLMAILLVIFLSFMNIFGVKTGAAIQNVFTVAKVRRCWDWRCWASPFAGIRRRLLANFSGKFLAQRGTVVAA